MLAHTLISLPNPPPQAVIPIGSVPPEVWGSSLDALSSFRHVSLSASRSFYQEGGGAGGNKSPLQHMDWASAYMHFRFLQVCMALTGRGLHVAMCDPRLGRGRTMVSKLKQIVFVAGLIGVPVTKSMKLAHFSPVCCPGACAVLQDDLVASSKKMFGNCHFVLHWLH